VCVYFIVDSAASGKHISFWAAAFSIWESFDKA